MPDEPDEFVLVDEFVYIIIKAKKLHRIRNVLSPIPSLLSLFVSWLLIGSACELFIAAG